MLTTAIGMMAATELKLHQIDQAKSISYLTKNAKSFEDIRMAAAGFESAQKIAIEQGKDVIAPWRDEAKGMRNPDGSYGKPAGDARTTAGAIVLITRLGGIFYKNELDASFDILKTNQRADGTSAKQVLRRLTWNRPIASYELFTC